MVQEGAEVREEGDEIDVLFADVGAVEQSF